jgi:sterol desaturase/sphingolipid hydroxylase (fatty acid hydroxylase superfamily)
MIESLPAWFATLLSYAESLVWSEPGIKNVWIPVTILLATIGIEIAARRNWRIRYGSRNFRIDVVYYAFYYGGFYHVLFFAWIYKALTGLVSAYAPWLQMNLLSGMPEVLQIIVIILVADFIGYWSHRHRHANRYLWAFHSIHHSQRVLTVATNYRFHIVDETVLRLWLFIPFQVFGTGIAMWLVLDFVMAWVLLLQHSEWNWSYGRAGRIFVSPLFHRQHHSTDERLQCSNYGMLFTFWDDLFGTAERRSEPPAEHGIAGHSVPETLWGQLVYPFRKIAEDARRPIPGAPAASPVSSPTTTGE